MAADAKHLVSSLCASSALCSIGENRGDKLDFDAMDQFIGHILDVIQTQGSIAARVFPADAAVLVAFVDRMANEVVS